MFFFWSPLCIIFTCFHARSVLYNQTEDKGVGGGGEMGERDVMEVVGVRQQPRQQREGSDYWTHQREQNAGRHRYVAARVCVYVYLCVCVCVSVHQSQ